MEERTYGGARRISAGLRPRSTSRSRKPTRRRRTPTSNAVVFPEPPKQPHLHTSTNFPLFSRNLTQHKPPIPQSTKTTQGSSSRNRQSVSHASRMRSRLPRSPTPVEEVSRSLSGSHSDLSRLSVSTLSFKSYDSRMQSPSPSQRNSGSSSRTSSRVPSPTRSYDSRGPSPSPSCDSLSCVDGDSEYVYSEDVFPFQCLPDDCKLKVFSLLPSHDKGRCAQVCVDWWHLIQSASLWSHLSFSDFPFWCITTEEHNCIGNCYIRYRVRVKQFLAFLRDLKPVLRSLEFKFDIGEVADGFMQPLEALIDKANTRELKYASLNWKETPARPFWTDASKDVQNDEMMQKHRFRQRLFVGFFDLFTKKCPNVETLVLPFDWSEKSVDCLLRLQNLQSLVLEKYFVFQKLDQDLLDRLLIKLAALKQFMLEVWTPSGHGLLCFSMVSPSLEYLDVSQSRGFYLDAVHLPRLKVFRVARHPWNGPLVLSDRVRIPCLYNILQEGAPRLEKINEHCLKSSWREEKYDGLDDVLKSVCSCRLHKSGWHM